MGLPVEVNNLMLGSLGGYTVGRSLRFRSSASAYLSRTMGSPNRTTATFSFWVKRGNLTSAYNAILFATNWNSGINFDGGGVTDTLQILDASNSAGSTYYVDIRTTQVFRDPSAWYHLVITYDTTNATASDRIRLYVNGVRVTAFQTATYPSQNQQLNLFSVSEPWRIGSRGWGSTFFFDGYLAEFNYIDGQALTPSSFGAYDTNGVWQPKKYSGTYGTNGFYLPFNWSTNTSYAGSFNGSTQYLTVPTNTAFDFGSGDFTIEAWVLTDSTTNRNIVAREYNGNGSNYTGYIFSTTQVVASTSGSAWEVNFTWSLPSANQWHHYALVRNGNVYSVYIDGIRVGTQTVAGSLVNGFGSAFTIGYRNGQGLPNGSISNLRVVKGTAVYTSNFTPPTSALTAISGTSLLTLQSSTVIDNSTNAFTITNVGSVAMAASSPFGASILADASGNNNGWFGNNINYSSLGTTYDSMIDSPTPYADGGNGRGNYAVMNPNFVTPSTTFSNGNLTLTKTGNTDVVATSTIAMPSGKWYWEFTISSLSSSGNLAIGIIKNTATNGSWVTNLPAGVYFNSGNGVWRYGSNVTGTLGTTFATNDILGLAIDMDAGTLALYKNNTLIYTVSSVDTTTPHYAFWDSYLNGESTAFNFGQRPFSYTPPSGFKALNTYNLPSASISNGAKHFAATLYTGNGGTQTISNAVNNVSFQPDFAWMKARNNTYSNLLFDSVRGGTKRLISNDTSGDTTVTGGVNSFNTDGITIQNDASLANLNASGTTYVGWQWKGGGTAVTNNSGTISSQVSANTSAGFSIVTYTGTGSGATVGHGLGVAPSMVIAKSRTSVKSWAVYHTSIGAANALYLDLTQASTSSGNWNSTAPTSSVFSVGTGTEANASGANYVAYCFSAVRGFSAFGSYTGNGSADGPMIYTGFRPRFLLVKNVSAAGDPWYVIDTSTSPYNVQSNLLQANSSAAELSGRSDYDILSNGFKNRATFTGSNTNGSTYIYAAFAENPFNSSRAR